ncbi:MAG: hypothetical protein WAW37_09070 [Syntrophobacteraceae bacterium]
MGNDSLSYFLFPGLALPEKDFRNLAIFLPRLSILEITRPAVVPDWRGDSFQGMPVIRDPEFLSQVKSCIQGYHAFAEVHGGSGITLGYLSRVLDDMSDSRIKIQEEMRGKCPAGLDAAQTDVLRAAVFLEIARELDEKEFELESGLAEADAIEKKFSEILGISEEDEAAEVPEALGRPIIAQDRGPRYMLPERIASWFRLLSTQTPESLPVFVATNPEAAEEAASMIRTGCRRTGKGVAALMFPLGSFPRLDQLGDKQFLSLIEAPGTPALLAEYGKNLDGFLRDAGRNANSEELESASDSLRQGLEKFCKICNLPGPDRVSLSLLLLPGISTADVFEIFSAPGTQAAASVNPEIQKWPVLFLCLG